MSVVWFLDYIVACSCCATIQLLYQKTVAPLSVETNWCAAKELCICLTAAADARHVCPASQSTVHAICGEVCEDASLSYHTTSFPCCTRYKRTFESPDNFQLHVGSIAAAQVMDGDDVSPEEEDVFDSGDFCPVLQDREGQQASRLNQEEVDTITMYC